MPVSYTGSREGHTKPDEPGYRESGNPGKIFRTDKGHEEWVVAVSPDIGILVLAYFLVIREIRGLFFSWCKSVAAGNEFSKAVAEGDFYFPGSPGAEDLAEEGSPEDGIRLFEVDVIEGIKELESKLKQMPIRKPGLADDTHIPVMIPGPGEYVSSRIPEGVGLGRSEI